MITMNRNEKKSKRKNIVLRNEIKTKLEVKN